LCKAISGYLQPVTDAMSASAAYDTKGGNLMGWMAPASTGVAMRHNAGV
jgi:hypothetical protein